MVSDLLGDPHRAERVGEAAQGPRHLGRYVDLLDRVLDQRGGLRSGSRGRAGWPGA